MGELIVIEGIDGAGKTTVSYHLNERLKKNYKSIYINRKDLKTNSAYINKFMNNIKKSLWESSLDDPINEVDEEGWLYLHMLWYHMFQKNRIEILLKKYDYVIMDGWFYKFWARHLTNGGVDFDYSKQIISRLMKGDIVFYLDISPYKCFKRKAVCNQAELGILGNDYEGNIKEKFVSYQTKVQHNYETIAKRMGFKIIDGDNTVDNIVNQIEYRIIVQRY